MHNPLWMLRVHLGPSQLLKDRLTIVPALAREFAIKVSSTDMTER
jgi:hypothetical protein